MADTPILPGLGPDIEREIEEIEDGLRLCRALEIHDARVEGRQIRNIQQAAERRRVLFAQRTGEGRTCRLLLPFDAEGVPAVFAPEEFNARAEKQTIRIHIKGALIGREVEEARLVHGAAQTRVIGGRNDLVEEGGVGGIETNRPIHHHTDGARLQPAY